MPSLSPLENAFERMRHRLAAHALAIAPEAARLASLQLARFPAKTNRAHRFRVAAARRAGDASDGDRDRAAAALERALRHLARSLLAHGAVLLQRRALHAEHLPLRFVRIGDESAVEPGGGAADRRHRLRR